ncbi:MAG: hypothetical protein HY859_09045 [Caulobacterales bacterium]|nr:hypothetical protein [Caulobacterales bacterium]
MGPAGPQGPQGFPGPADLSGSALGVFGQAVMTPSLVPYTNGIWSILDFDVTEWDSHLAFMPGWRWTAPIRGVYQLQASVMLQSVAGVPAWELQVRRSGQERAQAAFSGFSGQISWTGIVGIGEGLQVAIRPTGAPTLIDGGPPRTCITIAGCGVLP